MNINNLTKQSLDTMREDRAVVTGARAGKISLSLAGIILCLVFLPLCYAQSIRTCIDEGGNTVFTDGACPAGFSSKKQSKTTTNIIRKDITPSPAVTRPLEFPWTKHNVILQDIEMTWHPTRNPSQEKSILHPQVEFTVHNSGENGVAGLKIIMIFVDEANQIFGDGSIYINDIPAGESSGKTALYPSMGFVFNGYDEDIITDRKYTVEIYGRYKGDKDKITTFDFSSKTIK